MHLCTSICACMILIKNHVVHEVRLDFLRWFLRWFWPVFIQNGFRHLKDELSCLVNHWITWLLSSLWDVKNCSHHSHTKTIFIQINGCQRQYFIVKISSQILHSKYWIYWINHLCIYDNTIYHCYEEEMNKADHVISNYSYIWLNNVWLKWHRLIQIWSGNKWYSLISNLHIK